MSNKLTPERLRRMLRGKSVTNKQRKLFNNSLSKYLRAENGAEATMGGLTDKGFNYNGAWGGPSMAMGGGIPGSVGFTYARTQSPAPSNGPYAKKTKPSAQNGQEMKYYQEGLDFKPKTISKNGGWLEKYQQGGSKKKSSVSDFFGNVLEAASYISPTTAIPQAIKAGAKQAGKVALSRAAENLNPYDYAGNFGEVSPAKRLFDAIVLNKKESQRIDVEKEAKKGTIPDDAIRLDLLQMYAGKPQKFNTMQLSKYKPTVGKDKDAKYYSSKQLENVILQQLKDSAAILGDSDIHSVDDLKKFILQNVSYQEDPKKKGSMIPIVGKSGKSYTATIPALGEATYGVGEDEKGLYLSYYDKWDLNPFKGMYAPGSGLSQNTILDELGLKYLSGKEDVSMGLATPPEIYGRIYFDKKTGKPKQFQEGGIIEDPMGQWAYPGEITRIPSNEITMQGVDYPVLGISDTGDTQMMYPGEDYSFDGSSVTEIPMMQKGGAVKDPGYSEPDYVTGTSRRALNKMIGMGNYLIPGNVLNQAADMAELKGYGYGEDNEGPLDAVRHAAASASTAARIPVPKMISEYSPALDRAIRIASANALGLGYELRNFNPEGFLMDIKNNYRGSLVGSIPGLTDKERNKMIVNQLTNKQLTVDNPKKKKENGGWLNKYE